VLGLVFGLGGGPIIDLMATDPAVREAARLYLPWMILAPLIGIASWMLDGIFIGATLTREMRKAMIASVAVYVVALAVLVPGFGNHGLWGALMVLNAVRGLTMAVLYPRAELAADQSQASRPVPATAAGEA
jgi:MATE family multidrug resistance protein